MALGAAMNKLLYSVALLGMVSCTHTQALVVSGETIMELGDTFINTADAFNQALEHDQITAAQYNTWKQFGMKFQMAYPAAVELWHAGIIADDDIMARKAAEMIVDLQEPMLKFAAQISKIVEAQKK